MKLNNKAILLSCLLILPGVSTAATVKTSACADLPSAHQHIMSQLKLTRDYSATNEILQGTNGTHPAAAKNSLSEIDKAINHLQNLQGPTTSAATGFYPGYALQMHNDIKKIVNILWTANHFSALSFIYDKESAAEFALKGGLKVNEMISDYHKLTLYCYTNAL